METNNGKELVLIETADNYQDRKGGESLDYLITDILGNLFTRKIRGFSFDKENWDEKVDIIEKVFSALGYDFFVNPFYLGREIMCFVISPKADHFGEDQTLREEYFGVEGSLDGKEIDDEEYKTILNKANKNFHFIKVVK